MNTYTDINVIQERLACELSELRKTACWVLVSISIAIVVDAVPIVLHYLVSPEDTILFSVLIIVIHAALFALVFRKEVYTVFGLTSAIIADALRVRLSPRASARETLEDKETNTYRTYGKIARLLGVRASWIE